MHVSDYVLLMCWFSYIRHKRIRNLESHMQFADWCAPVKISNSAEYSVLQELQFQKASVCCVLPGGIDISHN
jgi:hypothetical protein